jgi:hypothetical protein
VVLWAVNGRNSVLAWSLGADFDFALIGERETGGDGGGVIDTVSGGGVTLTICRDVGGDKGATSRAGDAGGFDNRRSIFWLPRRNLTGWGSFTTAVPLVAAAPAAAAAARACARSVESVRRSGELLCLEEEGLTGIGGMTGADGTSIDAVVSVEDGMVSCGAAETEALLVASDSLSSNFLTTEESLSMCELPRR